MLYSSLAITHLTILNPFYNNYHMATTHSNKTISLSFFDLLASQTYISDY
jgi:hypothetical protein